GGSRGRSSGWMGESTSALEPERSSALGGARGGSMTLDEAQVAKIRTLIAEIIEVEEDQIGPQTRFEDLGADSLRAIEIMAQLENTFGVRIHQDPMATV